MMKNRSINKLFGNKVLVIKNPGFDASLTHKMRLACVVHFHTSIQVSVNLVALRGLVNPDKEVYSSREEDKDGMEQDPVKKTVQKSSWVTRCTTFPCGNAFTRTMTEAGKVTAQMA